MLSAMLRITAALPELHCAGTEYSVVSGDSCTSVARKTMASYDGARIQDATGATCPGISRGLTVGETLWICDLSRCTGASSAGLVPSECDAWISLFDSTNGTQWTNCYDSRLDPCGCIYDPDTYTRGLHCSADGIHITYIDLFHNNLCGVIPEVISALTGLTLLVLHANQLTGSIPQGLSALTSLNALNLHDNSLRGSIPGGLTELNRLTDFRLYRNRLTGVVPDLPFKNYTVRCTLECTNPAGITNQFECPLPKDSQLCIPGPPSTCSYCTGSSYSLAQAECTAWISLFDNTNGGATQWTHCGANRLDPCGCSYVDANKDPRGVTCSADGQHILQL
jgi:hypothetical protein